jgi:predicted dehydrogenase
MKTYRVGILGCGEVWQRHRLAFERSSRLCCACVYDPIAERTAAAAALTGARPTASADDVLTAEDVDIVAVLTPAFTHVEQVEKGAAAGKHFMLEKPLATRLAEGERIVAAIRDAGVKCFHPTIRALSSDLFERLREWTAADGVVGAVRCGFYHLVGQPVAPSAWMRDRDRCFPPAEYDPHVLDTFLTLTGDQPSTVWSHAGRYCRDFEQDDVTKMVITFAGGRYLEISVNWVVDPAWTCGSRVTFELVCERGFIRHNWFSAEWFNSDSQGRFDSPRVDSGGDRWDHYHALIDAIEQDGSCSPNEIDGLNYVRIQDAALQSIASGATVEL